MIYFLKALDFVKIGYSNTPNKRISGIKTSIPFDTEVVCITTGDIEDEKNLQKRFKEYQCRGEWYNISDEIIKYIKSCNNLMWKYGFGEKFSNEHLNPLKALRLKNKISMDEASDKLNITRQSYAEAEKRCLQGKITIKTLAKYGKALGGKLEYRFI